MNDRDKAKMGENSEIGLIMALILSGAVIIRNGIKNSNDIKNVQNINSKIENIERKINEYKSKLGGALLYSNEIDNLRRKQEELIKERKKYE